MGIGRHILVLRVRHDSIWATTWIGISHLILFLFRAKGKVYNMNTIYIYPHDFAAAAYLAKYNTVHYCVQFV